MLEAIDHFEITKFDVLIPSRSIGSNTQQVKALLSDKGIVYSTYQVNHAIWDFIPYIMRHHKYYKNIFIGNYYSPTDEAIAAFYGKCGYNLFFLDDGTQALMLFSDHPRYRYSAKKWELIYKLYFFVGWLKNQNKPSFFTIYDVQSSKFNIIKNSLNSIKICKTDTPKGCYIIGTNSSILSFKDCNYIDILERLISWLQSKFPKEKVYYCPHRRDLNNEQIIAICKQREVELFKTRVSVEYDFINKGLYPLSVVGFTSNALYTLRKIFPKSDIRTVFYHLEIESSDIETDIIRKRLNSLGIRTLYLS